MHTADIAQPLEPVTKLRASQLLSVAVRTIDAWIASGVMPAPRYIGRRAYWHPFDFNAWLDKRLKAKGSAAVSGGPELTTPPPMQIESKKEAPCPPPASTRGLKGNAERAARAKQRAQQKLNRILAD